MSLQVLNAHTGDKATADPDAFRSFDDFKLWLATSTTIPTKNQILLTAAGRQVKFHALRTENEIFLYDRKLITPSTRSDTLSAGSWALASRTAIPAAPAASNNQTSVHAWQHLFEARRAWAQQVIDKSEPLASLVDRHSKAVNTIQRGLGVAVDNLQKHVRTLETRFTEAKEWAAQAAEEQQDILESLSSTQLHLSNLPAKPEFLRFLPKLSVDTALSPHPSWDQTRPLDTFVQSNLISQAATTIQSSRQSIADSLRSLEQSVNSVSSDAQELVKNVEAIQGESVIDGHNAAWQLMEEIELVVKKVNSDFDHIASLPSSSKTLSTVSRLSSTQERNYLPPLEEYYSEMMDLVDHVIEQRNAAASRSLSTMQRIAQVESSFVQVNAKLMQLDMSNEVEQAFDYISLISQLPYVYGALLIEAVCRQEWSDRLKDESATLAEDIAEYRQEEEKRRKKWFNGLSHLISEDAESNNALNFEINLEAGKDEWPSATRDDVASYLQALRTLQNVDDIIDELSEAARDLDRPTKRQLKKARAFKMGSFLEANNPKGSFLLGGATEIQALRDSKSKLEEELKSQKSRIRKLEDLLYKQGQNSRSNSGNIFQIPDSQLTESPAMEHGSSRLDTPASRKPSITSAPSIDKRFLDDGDITRKLITLEADLHYERQKRLAMEAEAQSKTNDHARIKDEVEESRSTKKDLMENMEAQQLEFAEERKLLENQVKEYKIRLEDLEDEMDRILGSRDNEKVNVEAKLRSLESALADKKTEMGRRESMQADYFKSLRDIRAHLTTEDTTIQSVPDLLEELDQLVDQSSRQVKDLTQGLSTARSDKEELRLNIEKQEQLLSEAKQQISSQENELTAVRNEVAAEKAKNDSLSSDLKDGRDQLRTLRTKFAEGETGSEALRMRVEEQAARASHLATQLAEAKSHVNSLDVELSSLQKRHHTLQEEAQLSAKRLEHRSQRDRELTNRVVSVNEELAQLLEVVGLSIIYRDGAVSIQRTSKLANQSASASGMTFADPNTLPQMDAYDVSSTPEVLQWMHASSLEEEDRLFQALLNKVCTFNIHVFSEAIIKLRRDIEWTGKKWKQEARNYRDKYHRAQIEGHDKIAYKAFKEGDLALFLPTRNQATRPWAAFNVGAPHYFLRETDAHKLGNREWLLARISRVEERVVDLSRAMTTSAQNVMSARANGQVAKPGAAADTTDAGTFVEDDNPFELSDGLRWYLLDAAEEKAGAPSTPGLGKSTVASANVEVKGSIRMKKSEKGNDASGKLNKSLESRRSSTNSKRESISGMPEETNSAIPRKSSATHLRPGSRSSANNASPTTGLGLGGSLVNNWAPASEGSPQHRQVDEQPHASTPHRLIPTSSPSKLQTLAIGSPSKHSSLNALSGSGPPISLAADQSRSVFGAPQLEQSPLGALHPSRRDLAMKVGPNRSMSRSLNKQNRKSEEPGPVSSESTWESLLSLDITSSLESHSMKPKSDH